MCRSEARGPRPTGAVAAFFVVPIIGAPVRGRPKPASRARSWARAFAIGALALPAHAQEAAPADQKSPQTKNEIEQIEIIAPAPLPGLGVNINQVPANIQTIDARQIGKSHPIDSSEALERNLGSVNINDTQGGPLQADVNFRGFTASPILGTPQGISVFVDGVRVNEAFGDTVNWDLIPPAAISRITVIPGSNPVFGLNTLGGALAVSTKSGFEFPGTTASVEDGSWSRRSAEISSGGHGEQAEYFVAGRVANDNGWAQHNPSRLRQVFSKLGYQAEDTDIDGSLTYADNYAEGNQTIPLSFLGNPRQIYSFPDWQRNKLWFANLQASHALTAQQVLSADVYFRSVRSSIFNNNVNNNFDPTLPLTPGNFPANNITNGIDQDRDGLSLQYNGISSLFGHRNNATVGAAVDHGRIDFKQFNQDATVAPDRSTFSSQPIVLQTSLRSTDDNLGWYATDLLEISQSLALTLAGRFNRAILHLRDQLGTALNGDHGFGRFNPAVGLNFTPAPAVTTYASYNEGVRVPTPVELTCADPSAPCSLPNAFTADPALKPVISKTWELGARGSVGKGLSWSSAIYRSLLDDDIQFISSGGGGTSSGYFQNVGQTRRQGLELGANGVLKTITWRVNYAYIQATYRSALTLNSPDNSAAQPLSCPTCADIRVVPGNRLPGIPLHVAKLDLEYAPSVRWSAALNVIGQSSTFPRGDENNRDVHGPVPGFAVVNLNGQVKLTQRLELFAKVDNLFDRLYSSYGVLGANAFHLPGHAFDPNPAAWTPEQFRSFGAGRGAWVGFSYHFAQ
ncbi:MAG TPA: TonB-dependent receptor [Burkholderiaceae bacterium]|nr:TonB-dependent receptor [Burkholderiaceae bacterium]